MSGTSPFVVIIPARLGSTRLPNKPLLDLAGQPMIVHVAQRAQASGIATVIVATDSSDILAACAQAHIRAIATQPMLHSAVPAKEWALKDDVSWDTSTPPNHDTTRNALFFDGRVGKLDLSGIPL